MFHVQYFTFTSVNADNHQQRQPHFLLGLRGCFGNNLYQQDYSIGFLVTGRTKGVIRYAIVGWVRECGICCHQVDLLRIAV